MAMELEGTLIKKYDTQEIKNGFSKREFVVETEEQYPQKIKFELTKEKCNLIDSYAEGSRIKVHFNIRGAEWQGKYFVNLQAWRIEAGGATASTGGNNSKSTGTGGYPPPPEEPHNDNPFSDDLPF